jgi:hypothetical protein
MNRVVPLLMLLPNDTIQPVHASLKDHLLRAHHISDINPGPEYNSFFFKPSELHDPIAIALLPYLSFPCFKYELPDDYSTDEIQNRYPLLEYSSCHLIWHVTKVDEHASEYIELFSVFLHSTQGWRWLYRLDCKYAFSLGHQQLLQVDLRH